MKKLFFALAITGMIGAASMQSAYAFAGTKTHMVHVKGKTNMQQEKKNDEKAKKEEKKHAVKAKHESHNKKAADTKTENKKPEGQK